MNRARPWRWTAARILLGVVLLMPLLWAMWASLQPVDRIFSAPVALTPGIVASDDGSSPRWQNYAEAVSRLPFLRFLLNSALITTAATLGTVFTSSLTGFAFARLRWRGRGVCFVLLLTTMMLPAQVLLVPQFLVFEHLGWVNTYKPLIVPSWLGGSAFFIFLFRQFFRSVPQSYEDAARLDGATDWQLYRYIMLPMARPVIGAVVALSAVYHWQDFISPLVYLSDFQTYPVSVGLRMYQAMEGSWPNLIMAASLIALLPPLVVIFVAQRYLMRNIGVDQPRR